jgi:hypothetical protein
MGVISRIGAFMAGTRSKPHRYMLLLAVGIGLAAGASVGAVKLSGADIDLGADDAIAIGLCAVVVVEVIHFWMSRSSDSRQVEDPPPIDDAAELEAFASFHSTRVRLRGSIDRPESFERLLVPMLSELADDLLLRRRGIVRSRRPDRARQLLGEELSNALSRASSSTTVDIGSIERMLDRLEDL